MRKSGMVLMLTLVIALTACTRSLSSTPTQNSPLPSPTGGESLAGDIATEDPMAMLQQFATQTAQAQGISANGTPTPTPTLSFGATADTTQTLVFIDITETPSGGSVLPTVTPNLVAAVTSTPGRPGTYTLQSGEFPFCIARRFNVDPTQLLSINGLSSGELYTPGLVLKIPQTGDPFPGDRSRKNHPTTYTVLGDDTVYSIACDFGDVDPLQIAAVNGLSAPYSLTLGQSISIP